MIDIKELTIRQLQSLYTSKTISVKELVQEYINRIHAIDKGENGLNSIIEINPEVFDLADALDKHTGVKGKLYGVPLLLKDNIDTADNMHTSAGALALADSIAVEDADIVKKLRKSGAILLGKTNMTELANFMTKGMPAGYSSRGGQVKSPYKKDKNPSGSSSGSAVAVAANLCMASIGTDTSGSIVSPAAMNGIVGYRPRTGSLSMKGIVPISFTCDTVGPMTRTVTDTAILYSELTGQNIALLPVTASKGIRIGVNQTALDNMTQEEVESAEVIIKELEKSGAVISRMNILPLPKDDIKQIQRYEFKYTMERYLATLPANYKMKTIRDLIEYNEQHKEATLQYGQTILVDIVENTSGNLNETEYIQGLKEREVKKKEIKEQLKDVDLCMMWKENLVLQYVGLPIMTLPCGLNKEGMPVGMYLTSLEESSLIQNAYKLESLIGHRVAPKLER